MKRPPLQNKQVVVLRMAFRARKVFGSFEKRAPGAHFSKDPVTYLALEPDKVHTNGKRILTTAPTLCQDCSFFKRERIL